MKGVIKMKRFYLTFSEYKWRWICQFFNNKSGVTSIEYAVIAAGIAAIVSVLFANDGVVGNSMTKVFEELSKSLEKWVSTTL